MPTFNLHTTASDTYRVLVDGQVKPNLVGFNEPWQAQKKLKALGIADTLVYALHQCAEFNIDNLAWFLASERSWDEFAASIHLHELAYYVLRCSAVRPADLDLVTNHLLVTLERATDIRRFWDSYVGRAQVDDDESRLQISDDWSDLRGELGDTLLIRPIHDVDLAKLREKQQVQ